jgi:hypothetical protein
MRLALASSTARWRDHIVVTQPGRAPRVYAPEGARVHPAVEPVMLQRLCALWRMTERYAARRAEFAAEAAP